MMQDQLPCAMGKTKSLRIFLPFALGYFLSYLFRTVNAVIAPNITADLLIDPSDLGLLTATYFITFALAQLPLGVLLDRFGPRVVEASLLVFAATGAALFALSQSLGSLIAGRALIGFGVSACLMAAFKSYAIWFPAKLLPRINGFQMASGGLGALAATLPVEWALGLTSWRGLLLALALISLAAALILFFVVPKSTPPHSFPVHDQIQGIVRIFKNPFFWQIAPLTTLSQAGFISIIGLWSGPWLRDVGNMSRPDVAQALSWSAMAMISGFICLGVLAEKLVEKKIPVKTTAVAGMTLFILIQGLMIFPFGIPLSIILMLFGFFGSSGILSYTALTLNFPITLSGRVTTGINLLVFIAAFIVQWAIGAIINLWGVSSANTYDPAGYRAGFAGLMICQILSLVWYKIYPFKPSKKDTPPGES
ncbi:MAG: MFS transporter [Desulfobacter sp.]|nr:MAG: MFS transporter [Desulfobacter sp.]